MYKEKEIKKYFILFLTLLLLYIMLRRFNKVKWLKYKKFLEEGVRRDKEGKWKAESQAVASFKQALVLKGYPTENVLLNYRPDFLKNPLTGCNLELDAYDPLSRNAIEYNGIQHYEYPNVFHKSRKDFELQVSRDRFKIERCLEENINLISIPYTEKNMFSYILSRIK